MGDSHHDEGSLFTNLKHVRRVSTNIALAVAQTIIRLGLSRSPLSENELPDRIQRLMWEPLYPVLKNDL